MTGAITVLAALSENQNAWAITLGAAVVGLLVVIVLLEGLRRTVKTLGDDLWSTWVNGKAVVKTAKKVLVKAR